MEHVSLSAELGEICYAIEGAHWIADSITMGAVPDSNRKHSAPVIISALLLLVGDQAASRESHHHAAVHALVSGGEGRGH